MAAVLWTKLKKGFASLKGSSGFLYVVFVLNMLDAFAYFVLSLMYTIYLTEQFGIEDDKAGLSYGLWGTIITAYAVLLSPVVDFLGVKPCLLIGFGFSTAGRIWMAWTHSKSILFLNLYGLIPLGAAFSGTVLIIGIKRYAAPEGRAFAYGLYYSLMNAAAFVNGWLFDIFRIQLKHGLGINVGGPLTPLNDGYRLLLMVGGTASVIAFVMSMFLQEMDVTKDEEGAEPLLEESDAENKKKGWFAKRMEMFSDIKTLFSMRLVKYLIVCILTVNLKQIFRHLDATLPKFQLRAFGCESPVGKIYMINPLIIIFLVPVVQAATTLYNHYDVIHVGSYFTSLSPFFLFFFQTEWSAALFVVFLSIGEAIWSPRWYDFSMSIAPNGREAVFTALAAAPLFLAKLPTGYFSGWLLKEYCPDNGACSKDPIPVPEGYVCNGKYVWGLIGLITFTTPIGLLLGSRWLRNIGDNDKQKTQAVEGAEQEN